MMQDKYILLIDKLQFWKFYTDRSNVTGLFNLKIITQI